MSWLLAAILLLVGSLLSSSQYSARMYYVKPAESPDSNCPGEPCLTLNYYAQNASSLLSGKSNVSLVFLDGLHVLTGQSLKVSDTNVLTLTGMNETYNMVDNPVVNISGEWGMIFEKVEILQMAHISIVNSHYDPNGFPNAIINVTLARKFSQYNVTVVCCSLNLAMTSEVQLHCSWYKDTDISVSNTATFPFQQSSDFQFNNSVVLSVSSSCFLTSSLYIYLNNLNTEVTDVPVFYGYVSDSTGIVFKTLEGGYGFFEIKNCSGFSFYGLFVNSKSLHLELNIENSSVYYLYYDGNSELTDPTREKVLFLKNCTLYTAVDIEIFFTNITLQQCYLLRCEVSIISAGIISLMQITSQNSLFQLQGPSKVTIDGSSFKSNIAHISPFVMDSVDVFFIGETIFANNTGYQGGALYLVNTTLYFEKHSRLLFVNNSAINIGGAVYVDAPRETTSLLLREHIVQSQTCIFSLTYNVDETQQLQSCIYFEGNVAGNGGDNIYGTSLKSDCVISPDASKQSYQLQSDLFMFDNKWLSSISSVSSDPMRVCLCENGVPQCANYSYIVQQRMYTPGEKFTVSLVLVGADFGSITGSVYASLSSQNFKLGEGQDVYGVSSTNCSIVEYSFHTQENSGNSELYLASDPANVLHLLINKTGGDNINSSIYDYKHYGNIALDLATIPIRLNISIQKCPLGFVLDNGTFSCGCVEQLSEIGIDQCIVVSGTGIVYRSGTAWVSHSGTSDNATDGVLVYKYCPYGYCNTNKTGVDLYEPDSQCALKHSGILCGGCPSNLSLALGSSQCLPCTDDWHISLLVIFVIAGVALVLFIKLFDLTVTKGAVNGIIFYANIIWIHQSVFFPYETNSQLLQILKVFIAWLNLDLGIETCFFPRLDAYWKTWLQFIFPFYIWGLAGLIIILCHFSNKVTEVFGNNSVHVLTTLFLLSYVKLLRTIISSLVFAPLEYPDGIRLVWLLDGNILYLGLRHTFLFVAAIFVLLIFWLPYTATILLVPYLRKYCNISWIHKLKPFYDAHYGPLKDNHHYWIGLTLLVRVVIAVTAIALQAIDPKINLLLVVVLSSLLCLVVNQVYKKSYLSALEASFLVNLTVLAGGFLYVNSLHTQVVITCVSVGISLITFLAILIAQAYSQLKSQCQCCRVAKYRGYENIDNVQSAPQVPTHSIVSVNNRYETSGDQLREPLLESD